MGSAIASLRKESLKSRMTLSGYRDRSIFVLTGVHQTSGLDIIYKVVDINKEANHGYDDKG